MGRINAQAGITFILAALVIILVAAAVYFIFYAPSSSSTKTNEFSGLKFQSASANSSVLFFTVKNPSTQNSSITYSVLSINNKNYSNVDCNTFELSAGQTATCSVNIDLSGYTQVSGTLIIYSNVGSSGTVYASKNFVNLTVQSGTISNSTSNSTKSTNGTAVTTFTASGLPQGITWSVTYGSTTYSSVSSQIMFSSAQGSFSFSIGTVVYQGCTYTPSVASANLAAGSQKTITFSSSCPTTFTESGLPAGASWAVDYASTSKSSNSNSIVFTTSVGIFSFSVNGVGTSGTNSTCANSYGPSPQSGSLQAGASTTITFVYAAYCTTTFIESGLKTGTPWYVGYDGQTNSSSGKVITFYTTQSTYNFNISTISIPSGNCSVIYSPSPVSGTLASGSSQAISFSNATQCSALQTNFIESGLPSGVSWAVNYNGVNNKSTSNTVSFTTAPGTFAFSVPYVIYSGCNYSTSTSSGNLQASSTEPITFSATCRTNFTESGLPSGYNWSVTYNGQTEYSTSNRIVFVGKSGTFGYSIPLLSNTTSGQTCTDYYNATVSSGNLVFGKKVSVTFKHTSICFINFYSTRPGLGGGVWTGVVWNATYDGVLGTLHGNTPPNPPNPGPGIIGIETPRGKHAFSISNGFVFNSSNYCNSTYVPKPQSGSLTTGSNTGEAINFTYFSTTCETIFITPPSNYYSGTWWVDYDSVNVSGPIGSNITVITSNGTHYYTQGMIKSETSRCFGGHCSYGGFNNCSSSNTSTVAGGIANAIGGPFSVIPWSCSSSFYETGLPPGYTWNITYGNIFNGGTGVSTNPIIAFRVANSFPFGSAFINGSITAYTLSNVSSSGLCISKYTPSPSSGFLYSGDDGDSTVPWTTQISYSGSTSCAQTTTFTTSNLPLSATWYVDYNGVNMSAVGSNTISFNQYPGTFSFIVYKICSINKLYTPTPTSGNLAAGSQQAVSFTGIPVGSCSGYPN